MTIDNYDRVDFSQWREDMLAHLKEEKRRNALLQAALDKAIADLAKLQAKVMENRPAPVVVHLPAAPQPGNGDLNIRRHCDWLLSEAFRRSGGSKTAAAHLLGVNRDTVYAMLERSSASAEKRMAS